MTAASTSGSPATTTRQPTSASSAGGLRPGWPSCWRPPDAQCPRRPSPAPPARLTAAPPLHRADRQVTRRTGRVQRALRAELEATSVELLAHRAGDQDLVAFGRVAHPCGDVHVDSQEITLHLARLATVNAGALLRAIVGHVDLGDSAL